MTSLSHLSQYLFLMLMTVVCIHATNAQDMDSTQIGKEYPYVLPILGKKAYAKGYKLQLPFGVSLGNFLNQQGILIEDFEMAIDDPNTPNDELNYLNLEGILDFGPSEGRINTINIRGDAWILPFLSVGAYYGEVWGKQTITFSVVGSDFFSSTTDIDGRYYGFNVLALAPVGPFVLMADYSNSWTTNVRLDKPVQVRVAGSRLVKRIKTKTPGRYWAVWAGAQFQFLDSRTSGNIGFDEALGITEEDKQALDDHWESFMNNEIPNKDGAYWDDLNVIQKGLATSAYNLVRGVVDDNVYYQFNKKLEYSYNMLLGANYNHNDRWQFRAEYGFLKTKQQLMLMLSYRFGV